MSAKKKVTAPVDPVMAAATTLAIAHFKLDKNINIHDFRADTKSELSKQIDSLQTRNISEIESILYSQAAVLDYVFNQHMQLLSVATDLKRMEAFSQIAFKAQKQCRATLATLAEIIRPNRTIFVRQQNTSLNQQINCIKNELPEKNQTNELLSEANHETLEFRGTQETVAINTAVETVEAINRSKNTNRERSQ